MLHRPYIRKDVVQMVEDRAPRNSAGYFCDANTNEPIIGDYDLGHIPQHEFWRERDIAEQEGLTQEEFNDRMNNPDLYQIEDPSNNRSHRFEDKSESMSDVAPDEVRDEAVDGQSMSELTEIENTGTDNRENEETNEQGINQ